MGNLSDSVQSDIKRIDLKVRSAVEVASIETFNWLRSFSNEFRAPYQKGEGPRQARPGGWADITGQLVNSYAYNIQENDKSLKVVFSNNKEYAAALDDKPGYWVLSGLLNKEAGSPFEKSLMNALKLEA